ncbi:MAG: hypothetical protein AAFO72_06010 [Pseudomonadota bacterium]
MPLQNRVVPTGEIIAHPARGLIMGNRGILHDENKTLLKRRWQHTHWVTCLTDFKDRKRPLMEPGNYTELFFLDEAVSLAAGHRPCAECRRSAYMRFRTRFDMANGTTTLPALDRMLHRDRVTRKREQVRFDAPLESLPDGTMILYRDQAHLVLGDGLLRYSPDGYMDRIARPGGVVTVLTPRCTVATLALGYVPELHMSATEATSRSS